ncbi:amiloride-sensitive amine oxidase [copper-containing]-like [Dreissena polymorpha]|uniref:Amine oxidase n=1 Tax=Dreissena polymorpha TaxID=45954 RepID=A0A9D4R5G5_DREPO|nr:amiloride-sensitive amine oxidase [copper-containing]-like [Dreissena polymorpha]XP_052269784.1 amiloride-sensitive amine oxidase [copper-containing]-like [Dreissena polymorpha]KAH3855841.1 hypothetical protein DPMN_098411 [Dreissena polymorpha]
MIELKPLPMKDPHVIVTDPDGVEKVPDENGDARNHTTDDEIVCEEPLTPEAKDDDDDDAESRRDVVCPRPDATCLSITFGTTCVLQLVVIVIMAFHLGAVQYCMHGNIGTTRKKTDPGVFQDLSFDELKAVRDFMLTSSGIGLTPIDQALPNNSYLYMIDLHIPLKSSVLEHLDRGSIRLKRAAKAVVVRGDLDPPRVEEYLVSALPKPSSSRLARNPLYARYPIPYTSRPVDQVDYKYLFPILEEFTKQIYHVLIESYGLCYHNCTKGVNCMVFEDVAPRGRGSGERNSWFRAYRDVDGFLLHPIGLEVQIDHKSTNYANWFIDRIAYNGNLVYTVEDLLSRYFSGTFRKSKMDRPVLFEDELYSSYKRRGPSEMPTPIRPPRLIEPDGNRFTINQQHVKYMHWDFDVRMRPSTGLQIFDVRFQSERILYELSLQDGVVFSSGYSPGQMMSDVYLTSWMIGASSFELARGIDCPDTAAFVDVHHFVDSSEPLLYRNSICVFEQDPAIPLRRHYANDRRMGYTGYGGLVAYHLVVRHIATIQGSDYIFDYMFKLNGEIQIRVSPTGYVQATFNFPFERPFGNPLHHDVVANVHHHAFHFKADLDIRRVENRFSVIEIGKQTQRHFWYPGINQTQFVIHEREWKREMDMLEKSYDPKNYYVIYDDFPMNKYGTPRSYRVINEGNTAAFPLDEVDIINAAKWVKYPIVVTKYDDNEDQSSSIYAQNDPWDPVVDFDRFIIDNGTILNEDLIVWATLGLYHIPSTEDVPSTSTTWHSASLRLVPYNFFTECPSVSSPNTVQITPGKGNRNKINVNMFDSPEDVRCVPPTFGPHTYYGFRDNQ